MVVLPYKDRLELFSKYLQQLLMESLGKQLDRDGKVVNQGITALGNKGSTDQHSYIQQLRGAQNNFFVTLIEVLRDRNGPSMVVEPQTTAGDYLHGFLRGTRAALYGNGRESLSIIVNVIDPFRIGLLIALFERTVGFYASLINVNAYHQPAVEAGKKDAAPIIDLQRKATALVAAKAPVAMSAEEIADAIQAGEEAETVFSICERLAANPDRHVQKSVAATPFQAKFSRV